MRTIAAATGSVEMNKKNEVQLQRGVTGTEFSFFFHLAGDAQESFPICTPANTSQGTPSLAAQVPWQDWEGSRSEPSGGCEARGSEPRWCQGQHLMRLFFPFL